MLTFTRDNEPVASANVRYTNDCLTIDVASSANKRIGMIQEAPNTTRGPLGRLLSRTLYIYGATGNRVGTLRAYSMFGLQSAVYVPLCVLASHLSPDFVINRANASLKRPVAL